MNIKIKFCTNIDSAMITLAEHKLNIKFAPKGTEKRTVAIAIIYGASENSNAF